MASPLDEQVAKSLEEAQQAISQTKGGSLSSLSQARIILTKEESAARSLLLKIVLWVYAGWMLVEALLVLNLVSYKADEAMAHAKETIQLFVLPILTLVLGHYVGRNSK